MHESKRTLTIPATNQSCNLQPNSSTPRPEVYRAPPHDYQKSVSIFLRPEGAASTNPRATPWAYHTNQISPRCSKITSTKPNHRRNLRSGQINVDVHLQGSTTEDAAALVA